MPGFPVRRMRRLRRNERLRALVRETTLSVEHLIMPLFVRPGKGVRKPIEAMPGNFQLSVDELTAEVARLDALGVPAVLLFGIPDAKDEAATSAYDEAGVVQQAIRAVRKTTPRMCVVTDVCLCAYTSHGHCGVMVEKGGEKVVDNDRTLELLAGQALTHARAGADMVAPSDMMDGRVGAIRKALDAEGMTDVANRPRSSATVAATRWTRRTRARRSPRSRSISTKAPTSSW